MNDGDIYRGENNTILCTKCSPTWHNKKVLLTILYVDGHMSVLIYVNQSTVIRFTYFTELNLSRGVESDDY